MPLSRYLKITIGSKQIQVSDPKDLPVSIDYALEDRDNFQDKPSAQALSLKVPATLMNDIAGNTFRNPDIKDLTEGQVFRSNQPFVIDENGYEIMSGKAFLKSGTHTNVPVSYLYDLYGDNADWKIDLEESTLYDFLKTIQFDFTKANIIASWAFDGTDMNLPYVFAPVRYRGPIGGTVTDDAGVVTSIDDDMLPEYMKPSISKYFILYQAFKSVGYRIQSAFLDSEFFRRQIMPWTWGNFLNSDGTKLDIHRFLAKGEEQYESFGRNTPSSFWDLKVSNDSTDGGYDNNDDYQYDSANKEMKWTYKGPDFGLLQAHFSMQVNVNARLNGNNSYIICKVYWYKNGIKLTEESVITSIGGAIYGGNSDIGIKDIFFQQDVQQGDVISAKIFLHGFASKLGFAAINAEMMEFKLDYFRIPLDGNINFQNFTGFKSYKFLDFFRGLIDEFNLSINTDPINKIVVIEPTHAWSADNGLNTTPGYFVNDFLDWNGKEDLSKEWVLTNYSDYNRELTFRYKDDTNDGIVKTVQDRHVITVGAGKYVFPDRFKTGKDAIENRFFGATMHYDLDQWKALGTGTNAGIAPQMVCLIPENVSNTSNDESSNTFLPKSCYYKGLVTGVGAWKFDGKVMQQYPYMFAVNYKPGGENDPILSYSDENISGVIGKGLLKRFYWQRLAIMRNGQWYDTFFRLRNVDVANAMHREYKSYRGHRWQCIQIKGYKTLSEDSTAVLLIKWSPVTREDYDNTFPSAANVLVGNGTSSFDTKYSPLKCLTTDIPV